MKIIIFAIIAFVNTTNLFALTPEEMVNRFFDNYNQDDSRKALKELYDTNPWTSRVLDVVEKVQGQFASLTPDLVGKYYGYEKLSSKKVGSSYEIHTYFMKFDRQFMRITFQFYKPENDWRIYNFEFDDNYDEELNESVRLYRITED